MPWGYAIAAGGAYLAADRAGEASDGQSGAAKDAAGITAARFNMSRQDLAPYRAAGGQGINRLSFLTGTAPVGNDLVMRDASGIPIANANLYQTDPAYRRAWDNALQSHTSKYGRGYGDFSDTGSIEQAITSGMGFTGNKTYEGYTPGQAVPGANDPNGAGSLTRKFTLDDFKSDPVTQASFQFGLDEGTKAVQRMFGAKGMSKSGAALKGITRFANDYTGQKAGESANRFESSNSNIFNKLAAVSGIGQAATAQTATLGANAATAIGNFGIDAANARGAGAIASGNSIAGGLTNLGNAVQNKYLFDSVQNRNSEPAYAGQSNYSGPVTYLEQ